MSEFPAGAARSEAAEQVAGEVDTREAAGIESAELSGLERHDPLPMQRNVKVQNKAASEEAARLEADEIAEGSGLRFGTCIQAMAVQGTLQIPDTETSPTCLRFSACLRPRVCWPRSVRRCDCRPVGGRGTRRLSSRVARRCCRGKIFCDAGLDSTRRAAPLVCDVGLRQET